MYKRQYIYILDYSAALHAASNLSIIIMIIAINIFVTMNVTVRKVWDQQCV